MVDDLVWLEHRIYGRKIEKIDLSKRLMEDKFAKKRASELWRYRGKEHGDGNEGTQLGLKSNRIECYNSRVIRTRGGLRDYLSQSLNFAMGWDVGTSYRWLRISAILFSCPFAVIPVPPSHPASSWHMVAPERSSKFKALVAEQIWVADETQGVTNLVSGSCLESNELSLPNHLLCAKCFTLII